MMVSEDWWAISGLIVIGTILIVLVYLVFNSPTCEDKGGTTEFTRVLPMWTGKIMMMLPQYECIYD